MAKTSRINLFNRTNNQYVFDIYFFNYCIARGFVSSFMIPSVNSNNFKKQMNDFCLFKDHWKDEWWHAFEIV